MESDFYGPRQLKAYSFFIYLWEIIVSSYAFVVLAIIPSILKYSFRVITVEAPL